MTRIYPETSYFSNKMPPISNPGLREQSADRLPWNLLRCDVCSSFSDNVEPLVNGVASRAQFRVRKLVGFRPPEGSVSHALLHHRVEPAEQKIESSTFGRLRLHSIGGVGEGGGHRRLHARRRFKGQNTRRPQHVHRQFGRNLGGEEKTEVLVRLEKNSSQKRRLEFL